MQPSPPVALVREVHIIVLFSRKILLAVPSSGAGGDVLVAPISLKRASPPALFKVLWSITPKVCVTLLLSPKKMATAGELKPGRLKMLWSIRVCVIVPGEQVQLKPY